MRRARFAAIVAVATLMDVLRMADPAAAATPRRALIAGADLSSLPRVEAAGGAFHDDDGDAGGAGSSRADSAADAITLLRRVGFTSVRLRLWHSPADGSCALGPTLAMARRAQDAGMSVLLDLHYSDTWADPAHQSPPAAWAGLPLATLCDSVRAYTRDVLTAFVAQGTPPAYVQIGNEIDGGMLWDVGRLHAAIESRTALALLLRAGAAGAREASPTTKLVIHFANGGNRDGAEEFFAALEERDVPFDVMGVSYYPWWHGTEARLAATLRALAARFDRDVAVVETAYPWTTSWFDDTHNAVGKLPAGARPATPESQAEFAREVRRIVARVPGGRGLGVWWWEPAWLATRGANSPWENCALFDEHGRMLPAARALGGGPSGVGGAGGVSPR